MHKTILFSSICIAALTAPAFAQQPGKVRGAPVIHTVDDTELKPAAAAALPVAATAPPAARVQEQAVAANTQTVAAFSGGHIVIKLAKPVFTVGETLKFTVFTDQDCSIRIVHFTADKKAGQLLPNAFAKSTTLRAGEVREFPGKGDNGNAVNFRTTAPGGEEKVVIFVTEGAFKDNVQALASTRSASFPAVNPASAVGTRGEIKIEAVEGVQKADTVTGKPKIEISNDALPAEVIAASVLYKLEE